jgi:PAS domain S-box-containing protein
MGFLCRVLFLFIALTGPFAPALAQDLPATQILHVTVSVPREFPPHYSIDDSGRPEGFAIDLMERIAELSDLEVQYVVEDDWTGVEQSVRSGRAQVVPSIGLSEARKSWLDYTLPVETFSLSIFVREQTDNIKQFDDLRGRKVAAVRFNVGADLLKERLKTGVIVLDDARQALFELLGGHVDAVVYPEPVFIRMAREAKVEDHIKTVGESLLEIKRAIGVAKGRPELLARMDEAVARFVGTKEYQEIFVKWFGAPRPFWTTQRVALLASGMALIIFLLAAGWRHLSLMGLNRKLMASVAERKRAEELLCAIVENTHDGILAADIETRGFVSANKAICKMLGTTREQILTLGVKDIHPAEHLAYVVEQFERLKRGEIDVASNIPVQRTDGSIFLADISSAPVSLGDRACLVGVFRDITERKRAEQELVKARDELELRVRERTADLEKANDQLRSVPSKLIAAQEDERKRISGELHDSIGQTLAALKYGIETVLVRGDQGDASGALKLLERFVPTLQHSIEETRSIYMGLRPPMLDNLGLLPTLEWFCREFQTLHARFDFDFNAAVEEGEIPDVLKVTIFRIVQEALNNVAKHSEAERVELSLRRSSDCIELVVQDSGRGFDLESIIGQNSGRCLGIAGIRERVEATAGEFWIESATGKGTILRACWPI